MTVLNIEKIIRENIDKTIHMSLGTSANNKPWVCEVHFAYDKNLNLYFSTLTSTRHALEIGENPQVAGNIIKQHSRDEYPLGIYFEGTAKLLNPGDEQNAGFWCMKDRLGLDEQDLEDAKDPSKYQFYKITVDNWYIFGKFGGDKGQKYKLEWNGGK